jgi:hypothetical protein
VLQFAVMVGLAADALSFVKSLPPTAEPTLTTGTGGEGSGDTTLHPPLGVSFVNGHPDLLVVVPFESNQVRR